MSISALAPAQAAALRMQLVIANKNYSSWSMRPWVAMKAFGIPFEEIRIPLGQPDTAAQIARYSPAGQVPVLINGDTTVWDSLAICEYLAEQFPAKPMWPRDMRERALARSICAEMHAGFVALRSSMAMNISAVRPGRGRTPEALTDIARIRTIWETCLERSGQDNFLFGDFSIADAYFAPVVMRFRSYAVELPAMSQAYADRVAAHPAVTEWVQQALAELERIPKYEVSPD